VRAERSYEVLQNTVFVTILRWAERPERVYAGVA